MASRHCTKCGREALVGDAYCGRCGAKLTASTKGATVAIEPLAIPSEPIYAAAALVAAGTVAVGSFLPWASAGGGLLKASGSGIEGGDGWITLIIGAAAALIALRALLQSRKPHAGLLATTGIAAVALAAAELVSILSRPGTTVYGVDIKASPDLGLLAVAAGGIALVVIAVAANRDDPERAAPPYVAADPISKGGPDAPPSAKGVTAEVRLRGAVGDRLDCPACGDSASIRSAIAERDRLVVDWLQTPLDRWNAFDRLLQESTKPVRAEDATETHRFAIRRRGVGSSRRQSRLASRRGGRWLRCRRGLLPGLLPPERGEPKGRDARFAAGQCIGDADQAHLLPSAGRQRRTIAG